MTTVSRSEITITNVDDGRTPYFHTAYTNSTDFGVYDYSGNPNLMKNITNDSWTTEGAMKINAAGDYLELVKDTAGRFGAAAVYNIPALRTNSQYTTSLEFYLKSGTSAEDLKKCNIAIEATNTSGQVYYSVIYMNNIPKTNEWVDLTSTFTTNTYTDNLTNWKFRVYVDPNVSASMRIRNSIKIEKGPKATPYQPNIKDAPWHFSTVPLGENIADKNTIFPIDSSKYTLYSAKMQEPFIVGNTYTITLEGTKPFTQEFVVYGQAVEDYNYGSMEPVEGLANTWSLTFTPSKVSQDHPNLLQIIQKPGATIGACTINWLKIEKGDIRTPNIDSYKYLGNYTDFDQADSLNPTKYSWNLVKGSAGENSYLHTAWSWSQDGSLGFTTTYPNVNLFSMDLIKYPNNVSGTSWTTNGGWASEFIENKKLKELFEPGKTYSIQYSFELLSKTEGTHPYNQSQHGTLLLYSGVAGYPSISLGGIDNNVEDAKTWTVGTTRTRTATFTVPNNIFDEKANYRIIYYTMRSMNEGDVFNRNESGRFFNIKVEEGNTNTIYAPSVKDDPDNAFPIYLGTYSDNIIQGSSDPSKYIWSKIAGNNGDNSYLHVAWADVDSFPFYVKNARPNLAVKWENSSLNSNNGSLYPQNSWFENDPEDGHTIIAAQRYNDSLAPNTISMFNSLGITYNSSDPHSGWLTEPIVGKRVIISYKAKVNKPAIKFNLMSHYTTSTESKYLPNSGKVVTLTDDWQVISDVIDNVPADISVLRMCPQQALEVQNVMDLVVYVKDYKIEFAENENDSTPTPWVPPIIRPLFNGKELDTSKGQTVGFASYAESTIKNEFNINVPEWGATNAIRTTVEENSGTNLIVGQMNLTEEPKTNGVDYYDGYIYIKNNGTEPIRVKPWGGVLAPIIPPGTTTRIGSAPFRTAAGGVIKWELHRMNTTQSVDVTWWKPRIRKYDINHNFTETQPISGKTFLGTYTDNKKNASGNPADYEWNKVKGDTGESAKTLILSASSNTVKINQDSSIQSDTITLQANMQNMAGTATFSAIPYIGTTPQTAITLGGAGNIRTFSTSSWNKNWTFLVVTATFESFIDKQTIISVREGKDGADSITGLLTNESVTLPADKDGIVESFSEASGTFKIFDGLSDVTGRNVVYTLKNKSGGTFNINASTGVYNMIEMNKDSAIAVFEATYKDIKIEKILSVAKSKAGKETYTYTKYSNSKDFGNYDYSGNPNLAPNLDFSKFSGNGITMTKPLACFKDHETYLELDSSDPSAVNTSRNIYVPNCSALLPNNTYIMTVPIMINADFDDFRTAFVLKTRDGTALGTVNPPRENVGTWQNMTRVFTVPSNLKFDTTYLQLWQPIEGKGKIYVGYDIKIEKVNSPSDTATPYQPNLLDEPWHLSTVPVGENIRRLDAGNQPPLTTTEYNCYIGRINGYWKAGETYTITVEGTKPATQTFGLYLLNGSQHAGDLSPVEGLPDTWSLTFTPTKEMINVGVTNHANIFQVPQSTKGEVKINSVKIEKGKYRTPEIDPYKYMGVYVGGESEQPHNPTQYAWSQIKGNDSTSYSLLLSSQVMSLPRGASKLVPENITISGMAQTGEKSIENIKSRIVVEETTNGTTWTTKYDADALTYTYTPSSLNVLSARVKMYVAGAKNVQLDQKSINIVKDGSNGSNGSSSYTWIRYSENANGNPMTTTPNSKTKYIGIAITQTSTAPSAYSSYTWSRIKGNGGLVAKVYSNGGTNIEQSPIQINVETQSDGDIVEPNKVTWYMSKDSSVEWTTITTGNGITLNKKYIIVEPVVFLESNSISFKAQVEYNSMTAFDYMTVNNKSFDATKPLILRQPAAPLNPYPGLLWLDTSSGSGDPLDKTNPSLVYRWGKSAVESVIGTEYAHYAYANTPTGYQEDGVTPDPSFSVTYNSSQKPMYIGYCVTDTEPDPTTPSSYNWKSITTENGSEDVNGARGIAQEKIETTYVWGWVVLSASDLEMLPWLNNEDGSTIIDWIYQITQKTSDDSIVQTVVGSEDMSKVYAKTDAVDELSSANHELSDKIEEYNKQMQDAFAGIDTTYVNKSEFEQEMNKFNFGIDKAGGVNLIRNSTGFQWEDTAPSDEMLTNPKFEGTISTTGLNNGWVYNTTGIGQVIGAESDFPENRIMRIGGTSSSVKYSYSKNIPVSPGQLINISGQVRIPNTIGSTKNAYLSIRFYAAGSDPSSNNDSQTVGNGQGLITLYTDKTDSAGTIFGTDSYTVKTNNIVKDIWSNYSVNITIPPGAAFMKVLLYNNSTTPTNYFDFRKPSVVLYSGMFDFWHKNDSANAQIRQILGDESLEELGLIAGFELKGLRYKLDQDILLPNPNTEYTLSWYANKISQSGTSKYYVKVLNTKTGAEIAVSEASADTIGYQRMSVTFSVTNTSAVTIRIGLEGEGSADATLSAAGLMINIGPYPLSWQSHHEEVYSTNVRIDSSGLKVFNSDYDGYNVMTPREFAGYYRNGEVYERVFTLNKDTTKVKKLEAQERFMMRPVQIVSVDSPTIQGWAFVGYNGEDTD